MVAADVLICSESHKKLIAFALEELTRSNEHAPNIQSHASGVLVAIGRRADCKMVVEALMAHAKEGAVTHFMIMQCLGNLATENVIGVVPFIKTILSSILPQMGGIKLDHIKQSYAFGKFSNIFFIKLN